MEPIKEQTNMTANQAIPQNTAKDNSPYSNSPYTNNPYINNPNANNAYASYIKEKEDTVYTKRLKANFPFFSIGSLLYAIFYTFCLYKNTSGITYPFFVIGTLCYFFFSMKKLGVPYKKDSAFYMISIFLLGISNCLTNSRQILFMNKCGLFIISFILMVHTMYYDKEWNLPKYFSSIAQTIGTIFVSVFRPFSDMVSFVDSTRHEKKGKKSYLIPVLAGIAITIPILLIVTALLASADAVFLSIINNILEALNFMTLFEILFLMILVFFFSYAVYAALCMENVKEEVTDHRTSEPIIAIIVTTALSILYLMFSVIQILYLFVGNMKLPEGYTYSQYAREGFFQLLTVCILNLLIVLVCLYFFRENIVLKIVLTVMSGCTFIMILSSSLRMLMYISRYNLTFLRILVLWSLAVIFLLMAGVTASIYMGKFPLFTYSMVIVTLFYLGLSFSHPDYWIAKYNLNPLHLDYLDNYDTLDNKKYLCSLSADAAPILLGKKYNPYLQSASDYLNTDNVLEDWDNTLRHYEEEEDNNILDGLTWFHGYYEDMRILSENMHIRNFNFSVYRAEKYLLPSSP